jgi:chromosomal replication initiation ATPase DnaA
MKREIFDNYATKVADEFGFPRELLFIKTKSRNYTNARHMLYYLCSKRPINVSSIMSYMGENGYDIGHSSVIYGIKQTERRMREDRDYIRVINRIQTNVQ